MHLAQLRLAQVQRGELDVGERHIQTAGPAREHAIGLPKVGVATVIEQLGNRVKPEDLPPCLKDRDVGWVPLGERAHGPKN